MVSTIVWLDLRPASSHDQRPKSNLSMGSHRYSVRIEIYNNVEDAITYISQLNQNHSIIVYITGVFLNDQLSTHLRSFPQVHRCFVIAPDQENFHFIRDEQWSSMRESFYTNMFNQDESLPHQIIKAADFSVLHEAVTERSLHILSKETIDFMWFQLMMDALTHAPSNNHAKSDLTTESRAQYQLNKAVLEQIQSFDQSFQPDQALTWYTADSFLYRLINQSFRSKNIDEIFKYRYFIAYLHHQLSDLHRMQNINRNNKYVTLFRGQYMSQEEFDGLHEQEFIAMNSFVSTTTYVAVALIYCDTPRPNMVAVIFQMDIDSETQTTPFADIHASSKIKDENEVLVSFGALFQIVSIDDSNEDIYFVHLIMTSEIVDKSTKELTAYLMVNWSKSEELSPMIILANFMAEVGRYESAMYYYLIALDDLPDSISMDAGTIHTNIGMILTDQYRYQEALIYHRKALYIYQRVLDENDPLIAGVYNNVGYIHDHLQRNNEKSEPVSAALDARLALENYQLAMKILEHRPTQDFEQLAKVYNNIAGIYYCASIFDQAVHYFQRALDLKQTYLPNNHRSFSVSHTNIGMLCLKLNRLSDALFHCRAAIRMKRRYLPNQHEEFAIAYSNLSVIHSRQHRMVSAWLCAMKAYEVAAKHFSDTDSRRQIHERLYRQLDNLVKTIENIFRLLPHILIWTAEQDLFSPST